jgi:ParB family chromosome partitioning protein
MNARLHPERNLEAVKKSLVAYGQVKPVVVRKQTKVVVAGNGTLRAAKALGWTHIAAVIIDMTDVEAAGYGLADNRTAELAKWDFEVVSRIDKLLQEHGHSAEGWTDDELEYLRKTQWQESEQDLEQQEESGNFVHVGANSGNNEWYTPPEYIEAAREVLGNIDLDPASCDEAQKTVQANTYYTEQDDGLVQEWSGRVWMNPPYSSDSIGGFIDKLVDSYMTGDVTEAIVLVNNATETEWFSRLMDAAICLCLKRGCIRFLTSDGEANTPLQGQIFAYLGDNPSLFNQVFSQFGTVLVPYSSIQE